MQSDELVESRRTGIARCPQCGGPLAFADRAGKSECLSCSAVWELAHVINGNSGVQS